MQNFETLEVVKLTLDGLAGREEPLVQQIAPLPGSRAERFMQLFAPEARSTGATVESGTSPSHASIAPSASSSLADRVTQLEADVATLRERLDKLAAALGESDVPSS